MSNPEKEIEITKKAIEAIISDIANAKNTLKAVNKACEDIITLLKNKLTSANWESLARVLLRKVGNTTFYALYLKNYFEENGVAFIYNVKKDKIFYAGNVKDIKISYTDWKEQKKLERKKANDSLTSLEKLKKDFSKIEKLNKEQLEQLKNLVIEQLKKTI